MNWTTYLKLAWSILWNIRTIITTLDIKTFPGISDPAALRIWLIGKAGEIVNLAVALTPGFQWDEVVVEEIQKMIADDEAWPALYWVISCGIIPMFSAWNRNAFIGMLRGKMVARCDCENSDCRKPFRQEAGADPVVIASILSIFVSVVRIVKWFVGGEVEIVDDTEQENDTNIPDIDNVVIPS